MSFLTNPTAFRRVGCALALIVANVLGVLAVLVTYSDIDSDDTKAYFADVAAHPDAHAISGLMSIVAFPLLLVGVLGIVHLIRGRGVTLAHIGGVLAIVGLGAFPLLAGTEIIDSIGVQAIGQEQMLKLSEDGLEESGYAIAVLLITLVPALLGALLIGIAVLRSRLAAAWAGIAIIAGTLLLATPGGWVFIIGNVLHLIGFSAVAVRMLQMSDSEWEHPPLDWRGEAETAPAAARRAEPAAG
ncbi:MAG: hypothetical protein ACR2NA_12350 [Solirubrobacterales bacterium]